MRHYQVDAALGLTGSVPPLLRREGLERQRVNLASNAVAQRCVDSLVSADTAKAFEFVGDDQCLVVALPVRTDLGPGPGQPGLDQARNFSWIHG